MKYSLINDNNIIVGIYDSIDKIKSLKTYNETMSIIPAEEHHKKGLDINSYVVITNKEKIEKGIIKLEKNQVERISYELGIFYMTDQERNAGPIATDIIVDSD